MPTLTLAKALKRKKRAATDLSDLSQKIIKNNVYLSIKKPSKTTDELLTEYNNSLNALIELKVKIQEANIPVAGKIIRLAELKGMINIVNRVDTDIDPGYAQENVSYELFMDDDKKEEYLKNIKDEIDKLQDELDAFNASIHITIS